MVSCSNVVLILFAAVFAASIYSMFVEWSPLPCETPPCVKPLFDADTRVDLYMYGRAGKKAQIGVLPPARMQPLWVLRNVSSREAHSQRVRVALPKQAKSYTALFILARTGVHFDRNTVYRTEPDANYQHPHGPVLASRVNLVSWMSAMRRNRTMLIGGSSNNNNNNNNNNMGSKNNREEEEEDVDHVTVPLVPQSLLPSMPWARIPTRAGTALAWAAGLFATGAVFSPSPLVAGVRFMSLYMLLAAASHGTLLYQQQALHAGMADLVPDRKTPEEAHWKPSMTLRYVYDDHHYPSGRYLPLHVAFDHQRKTMIRKYYAMLGNSRYVHPFYADEFMLQRRHLWPVADLIPAPNEEQKEQEGRMQNKDKGKNSTEDDGRHTKTTTTTTTKEEAANGTSDDSPITRHNATHVNVSVSISFAPTSRMHFQFLKQLEEGTHIYRQMGLEEQDLDDVKDLFSSRLYIMALTYVISMLHIVFEFLAFKNDVGFFKSRKDYTGLSSRSILSSFICQVIIFLYLADNDYTSRLILGSAAVSVVIEGWKVKRVMRAHLVWRYGLPWVGSAHAGEKSKGEQATDEIDAKGMRILSWVLYPLVAAWGVYSLLYHPHKGVWSWLISTLANGVYVFGFVLLCPQLFINYKLKSVAHLPWRVFMYKAFNTFIDDAFAWMIAMPTAHRIACLRDDLVFFVYLYQRYLYPVDKTRPNEFGIAYEAEEQEENKDEKMIKKDETLAIADGSLEDKKNQ